MAHAWLEKNTQNNQTSDIIEWKRHIDVHLKKKFRLNRDTLVLRCDNFSKGEDRVVSHNLQN